MASTTFEALVEKWGGGLAVRIPKEVVESEGLQEGKKVELLILHRPDPKAFGSLRGWNIDPQKLKDELREDADL